MRIGIDISVLNDTQRTGIGVYAYELIRALLNINQKDKFILFGIATLSTYDYLKNLEFKDYPNVEMKIYKMPAKFFRLAFLTWQKLGWPPIEKFIGPVDIFHSFNWFMPPQRGGKKVATVFDLTSILFPEWHDSKTTQLDKARFQKIAESANLVITISESTKNDFLKFNPRGQMDVIYPAVREVFSREDSGNKGDQGNRVLRKYKLEPGYLLAVGTLEPRKNLETLVKAYLKSEMSEPLVLVGKSGWKNEQLLSLIKEYPQKIKQLGFIPDEDLAALFRQASCFIYPSLYEGFGMPVLESMAVGTPVITSNVSSLPEVGGDAAKYVDPGDPEEIVRAIREVVGDKGVGKKMVEEGFKQARKFSWEESAKKLNALYQEVTS